MAPALTQAAEPPSLAEATRHTSPPPPALTATEGIECLSTYDKWVSLKSYLKGGEAPSAYGWVKRCPPSLPPVASCTMEDALPVSLSDGGTAVHSESPQADVPPVISSSLSEKSPLTTMGYQDPDIPKPFIGSPTPPTPKPSPSHHPPNSHQHDFNDIMGSIHVNDFIDTLTSLASNTELGLLAPNDSVSNSAPPIKRTTSNDQLKVDKAMEQLRSKQERLNKKKTLLLRRLRRVTARGLGGAVSSQLNHLVREGQRSLDEEKSKVRQVCRSPEPNSLNKLSPDSMKNMTTTDLVCLVRRVEASENLQRRKAHQSDTQKACVVPALSADLCMEADVVAAEMKAAALQHIHHDSDATDSSSGGESCDEEEQYQQNSEYRSIRERALYQYSRSRGLIASKWTWLETQIADVDHKIATHQKYLQDLKDKDDSVLKDHNVSSKREESVAHFEPRDPALTCLAMTPLTKNTVNGYHHPLKLGSLCDSNSAASEPVSCARTMPFVRRANRTLKRPHDILMADRSLNAATFHNKFSGITQDERKSCQCVPPKSCVLCVKLRRRTQDLRCTHLRYMKLQALVDQQRPLQEKLALIDERHHPILSQTGDMLQTEAYSAYLHSAKWQEESLKTLKQAQPRSGSPHTETSDVEPSLKRRRKDLKKCIRKRDDSRERSVNNHRRNQFDNDFDEELARWQMTPSLAGSKDSPCPSPGFDKFDKGKHKQDSESRTGSRRNHNRNKQNHSSSSYDINNIVIPYSMAAVSTVESLDYKEILTPAWRVEDLEPITDSSELNTSFTAVEDTSDEAYASRHLAPQELERKKFFRNIELKGHQRVNKPRCVDSSGTNTPDNSNFQPVFSTSPGGSPESVGSEDSNHSTTSMKSNGSGSAGTVLTLSLSALRNSQQPVHYLDDNAPEKLNSSEIKTKNLFTTNSSATSENQSPHSTSTNNDVPLASEKLFRPINPAGSDEPEMDLSPFPSRSFPLNDTEFGNMITDEPSDGTYAHSIEDYGQRPHEGDQLTFSLQSLPQATDDADSHMSAESGRSSPLSEVTDSAPEEDEFQGDDVGSPDWTILGISNRSGDCFMKVQRH